MRKLFSLEMKKGIYLFPLFFFLLSGYFLIKSFTAQTAPAATYSVSPTPVKSVLGAEASGSASSAELYTVKRVIDGDTIEVLKNNKTYTVRYVGMDTPETVDPRRGVGCFGHEASNENKKLVEGKEVLLQKDVSETDKYGRMLRLVYLKVDDSPFLFVNDFLVREGYAKVMTLPPDVKFSQEFLAAQTEAQVNRRGLWDPSTCGGITTPHK